MSKLIYVIDFLFFRRKSLVCIFFYEYKCNIFYINTGLRISTILKLKVEEVKDKTHIVIREQESSKRTQVLINLMLRKDIENYVEVMNNTEDLFKSRKGENKPITRVQAEYLSNVGKRLGMAAVGTHTLRKTFTIV